jgi:hypothetical protein
VTAADPTTAAVAAAVELGHGGQRAEARTRLAELWHQVGEAGDPLLRVTIAHFLADLQDDVREELAWDERALSAVAALTDERAAHQHPGLQVRGFLPSLHLNLADCHRRLGDPEAARRHLARAEEDIDVLAGDDYGSLIRAGLEHVRAALGAGSTDPLPSAP